LARWRSAVDQLAGPPADALLAAVRESLADDLNAPSALHAIDRWVEDLRLHAGPDPAAPGLVRDLVDALLGVKL